VRHPKAERALLKGAVHFLKGFRGPAHRDEIHIGVEGPHKWWHGLRAIASRNRFAASFQSRP